MRLLRVCLAALVIGLPYSVRAAGPSGWTILSAEALRAEDDDIARNDAASFDGIDISEYRFRENGFDWHLIRFRNSANSGGPLWIVPHDDENAAFDAMILAVREHGGVGIAVNSGPGSVRRQSGNGRCGVRPQPTTSCDPNRNFDVRTPLFTAAFLDQRPANQPVIAFHTNSPGFSGDRHGGQGDTTVLDALAFRRGVTAPRTGAILARGLQPAMANYDTFGLVPYRARERRPPSIAVGCAHGIAGAGMHFWNEPVRVSDGSMSNYLALNRPDIAYFNAESRAEPDPAVAAARHRMLIAAYLRNCAATNS